MNSHPVNPDFFPSVQVYICLYWQWHPTPVLLPGKSHGWRSLVGCSPWGHKESDTPEQFHFHFSLSCIGEGNGNPLQCSCLENPRDGGACWAAVYGVAESRTWLKRLSSSSSSSSMSFSLWHYLLFVDIHVVSTSMWALWGLAVCQGLFHPLHCFPEQLSFWIDHHNQSGCPEEAAHPALNHLGATKVVGALSRTAWIPSAWVCPNAWTMVHTAQEL